MDGGLAGGLRAWLEDGALGAVPDAEARHAWAAGGPAFVVCDGELAPPRSAEHRRIRLADLQVCLTRVVFRLTVTAEPPRHPFEDALCAISVTEHGPELLDAVRRLRHRDRAALRSVLRARAATIASHWRLVPPSWLPRTEERLRVPLAGGAVVLTSTADLVLGRPSSGAASICLVRLHDATDTVAGAEAAGRARRALALAETLRSSAPPWRVATYDPDTGRLVWANAREDLLFAAVGDVLRALGGPRAPGGTRTGEARAPDGPRTGEARAPGGTRTGEGRGHARRP